MPSISLLLAQRHNWERLGDRFSGPGAKIDTGELLVLLLCLAGVGLLVWLLYHAGRWQEGRTVKPHPGRLFRDLCRAHRLNRWERRVLRDLAEATAARQPAEVFVRPEAFRTPSLPASAGERPAALEQLRRKLFPEVT